MKALFFSILFVFAGCTERSHRDLADAKPKALDKPSAYARKVDNDYFYPSDSSAVVSDTTILDFHIRMEMSPVPDSTKVAYEDYFDSGGSKHDRIRYRDYTLRVTIHNSDGTVQLSRTIQKSEFVSLMTLSPEYYFIRKVTCAGIANGEFRFDIALSWMQSRKRYLMVKYFISSANVSRFENYPSDFYVKEFPSPD